MKVANLTQTNCFDQVFHWNLGNLGEKNDFRVFYKRFFTAILLNLYYSSDCIIRQNLNTIAN
jgi:hypothetical protein